MSPSHVKARSEMGARRLGNRDWLCLALLTPMVMCVHGYHPLADDGAVYVAGIKKLIDPTLYSADAVFALSPTRLSIFAHLLATVVRWTRMSLPGLLLLCHLASIFLFLLGCWKVANRIFATPGARWGAVLLAACCFTLPVAGTSLDLMDPYVTARSFSTPLSLFALAAVFEEKYVLGGVWLLMVALLHPLMAAFTAIVLAGCALALKGRWVPLARFCALGWVAGGVLYLLTSHPDKTQSWNLAALSRSYYFLGSWQWYEYLGLVLPLLLLALAAARAPLSRPARALTIATAGIGCCALLTSLCFVHRGGSLWLARLQPLRSFQWVYLTGLLLAGGLMGTLARKRPRIVAGLYACIAMALFSGQRLTYPASSHVEWPGRAPINDYQRAFLWIRGHTPVRDVFALDNDYAEAPGEDAQGFRATAERSALADYFKDGGIASNFPLAADVWLQDSQATAGLNQATDAERRTRLLPLGASWIVLPASSGTSLDCPFVNPGVRVCRVGILIHSPESAK